MKKGSKRAAALLQELLFDQEFLDFVENKRLEVGIPAKGFESDEAFLAWQTPASKVDWDKFWTILDHVFFFADSNTKISYEGVMDEGDFKSALYSFVMWNKIDIDVEGTPRDLSYLLFESFVVIDGKKYRPKTIEELLAEPIKPKHIVDGVYLKVSPTVSIKDIKDFLDTDKDRIRKLQKIYLDEKGLMNQHLKFRPTLERDRKIFELMNHSVKELRKLSGINGSTTKQHMVSEILHKQGVANITPDAVKKSYSRLHKARAKTPFIVPAGRRIQGDS